MLSASSLRLQAWRWLLSRRRRTGTSRSPEESPCLSRSDTSCCLTPSPRRRLHPAPSPPRRVALVSLLRPAVLRTGLCLILARGVLCPPRFGHAIPLGVGSPPARAGGRCGRLRPCHCGAARARLGRGSTISTERTEAHRPHISAMRLKRIRFAPMTGRWPTLQATPGCIFGCRW